MSLAPIYTVHGGVSKLYVSPRANSLIRFLIFCPVTEPYVLATGGRGRSAAKAAPKNLWDLQFQRVSVRSGLRHHMMVLTHSVLFRGLLTCRRVLHPCPRCLRLLNR